MAGQITPEHRSLIGYVKRGDDVALVDVAHAINVLADDWRLLVRAPNGALVADETIEGSYADAIARCDDLVLAHGWEIR